MASSNTARRLRWAVPGAAAAAVATAALLPTLASGSATSLPERSAAQLLASFAAARVDNLHGTVVETARLGLPALPSSASAAATALTPQALLSGSHTARVWYAGRDHQRVALLGSLLETDVVRNGREVWTYVSSTKTATRYLLPAGSAARAAEPSADPVLTPQQAADAALKAIDPTTAVHVDRATKVAGRSAYQLVLTPKDSRSLVQRVVLAMDGKTSAPLRVQVYAVGHSTPAFETGFTDVTFRRPSPSVFTFRPPAGAVVRQGGSVSTPTGPGERSARPAPSVAGSAPARVIGQGWTAVGTAPFNAGLLGNGSSAGLVRKLATRVAGGQQIALPLVTIFLSDTGTVWAGPVQPDALRQVVATGKPL